MMKEKPEYDDEAQSDLDILSGLSLRVIDSPEGAQALVAAAKNTESPAKGTAQFVVMLMENVSNALQDSGIEFDAKAWMATDGVLPDITDDIIDALESGGIKVGRDKFAEELYFLVADMVKGIAQSEEAQASGSPTAGAGDMLAQAPLLS